MSMIQVDHLTFSYPGSGENVFEDCSFQIDTRWRLGFVGRNGRGKTTLLRLLQGEFAYRGTILCPVPVCYFPAPVQKLERSTGEILLELCPQAQEWELLREFAPLKLEAELLERPFATLSNGERTRALLAAFFLDEGRFPLIDEPTNHLDIEGRALVSRYLRSKRGYILVSHDRHFLDGCVDHILSLNRASVDVCSGNFSVWFENFQRQQAFEESQNRRLEKDVERLRAAARRTSGWSDQAEKAKYGTGVLDRGYVGHKAAKVMKRAKAVQARQERALEEKSALLHNTEKAESLKLHPLVHHSPVLAEFSQVSVCYGGEPVCQPVSCQIRQGERVALAGRNGSGKSSLLKLLLGQDIPHEGRVSLASGLVISYVPQDTSGLAGDLSQFAREQGLDETLFKTILRKLDFDRALFGQDMAGYSQGQKKKVYLARSLCQQAHLYVWDEPLNYVDLYSRIQLEELIQTYRPTLVFVEHDRAFQEKIATQVVEL